MTSSIFLIETSQLTFDDIKSFCNQGFSEGIRIEYKKDFPKNLGLVETICAFANTHGGIILVGVEAEEKKNKPKAIPGIELKNGLEEKVINLCLSHISPTIVPEVKVCDFKSDPQKSKNDRAVIFIRIRSSYIAPHYLLANNEIKIRVHNRNCLADLRTIESLINRREETNSEDYLNYVFCDYKHITVENNIFETVVVSPQFQNDSIIDFYNKENSDWLLQTANDVMSLDEQRPEVYRLKFIKSNSSEQIIRYCSLEKSGSISFQRSVDLEKNKFFPFWSIDLVARTLNVIAKIYSRFNFFSDLAVGLTIANTKDLELGIFDQRLYEPYICKDSSIKISKPVKYDELTHPKEILEEIFKEICVHFGLVLPEKTVVEKIKNILTNK